MNSLRIDYTITIVFTIHPLKNILHRHLLYAFAMRGNDWMVYLGAGLSFLEFCNKPLFRSIISKNVQANEVGKVFSVVAILDCCIPFVTAPLFGILYKGTLVHNPNVFLFVITGLRAGILPIMVAILTNYKIEQKRNMQFNDDTEGEKKNTDFGVGSVLVENPEIGGDTESGVALKSMKSTKED